MTNLGHERRPSNNKITYTAAHLVNAQYVGMTYGFETAAAEVAHDTYEELFEALGSSAERASVSRLARETELGLPIFQLIERANAETYAKLAASIY